MSYLLPCACGNQIPVEPKDAGLTVTCSCGAQVKVPNTRGMAALPRLSTGSGETADESAGGWGLRNQLLTAGLACLLFGGIVLGYAIWSTPVDPSKLMAAQQVGSMNLEQLIGLWQQFEEEGFQPLETDGMAQYEQDRDESYRMKWIAGAILVGGGGLLLAAILASQERGART